MHPRVFAAKEPERPAVIMGATGTVLTYAELEVRSNQVAWPARCYALRPGDRPGPGVFSSEYRA